MSKNLVRILNSSKEVLILDYENPDVHIEYKTDCELYKIKNTVDHNLFVVFEF